MVDRGMQYKRMVMAKLNRAYDLSDLLMQKLQVKSEIRLSSVGKVTLMPTVLVTPKTHRLVSDIQQVLDFEFLKNRTRSNRCVYIGAKSGVAIRLRSDIPVCIKGEKKIETVPRSRSYFTCPLEV